MLKKLMEILKEKGLDYDSFFFLYGMVNNIDIVNSNSLEDIDKLLELEYIDMIDDNYTVTFTQKGIDFIKEVVVEIRKEIKKEQKKVNEKLKAEIKEWIDEYRQLFKGTKPGAMGDAKACLDKMIRFFEDYPDYASKETVFNAAKNYINIEAGQNYKYLQRADYFIYKLVGKEETSRLASFCEETADEPVKSFVKML
jgi:NAD-specific glutamate dehydrogenase